jgi:hypothetical protein
VNHSILPAFLRAIAHGFAIAVEPTARNTFIVRCRPAIRDARYPATMRLKDWAVERESVSDALAQVLTVTTGELDMDQEERDARFEAMDREDAEMLLGDTAPLLSADRDNRLEAE